MTQQVGLEFTGSSRGAVGAAQQTAAAIAGVRREATGLSPSLQTAERDIGKMSRGAIAGSGALRGLGRSIAFASTGFLGAFGLAAAVRGAADELVNSVKVNAQVQAVLRSTGGVAGVTAHHVDALAQAELRKTGADDELIKKGEAVLLTFTNVRNVAGRQNDVFDRAVKVSQDLSVALGQDLNSSIIQVGKALQDPITGMTALRRVGVSLDAQQRANIKTLVDQGNLLGAQRVILRELEREFGGTAEKVGQVAPWMRLRETLKNLSADAMKPLLPVLDGLTNKADKWANHLEHDSQAQQRLKHDVEEGIHVAGEFVHAGQKVVGVLGGWKSTLELLLALKVASKLSGWTSALKLFIGSEAAMSGAEGAAAATGTLNKRLALLRTLASKPFQIVIAYEIIRRLTHSAADLSQGTASDSTITVGGKQYVIGSGDAWKALIAAGWTPPKGVTIRNVTAQQEIGAARSLGGGGHIAGRSDGTVPSTAPQGIVATAQWAARQPGAATSYKFGGTPGIGKGTHTDCSGFTQAVYKRNGISIPRTSQAQYASAPQHPKRDQLRPGDLVFFNYEGPHSHVGIYIGRGMMIGDQHTGSGIVTVAMDWAHYDGAASYSKMPRDTKGGGGRGGAAPPHSHDTGAATAGAASPIPAAIRLAISQADRAAAAAALTPGKRDDRRALAEQRHALEEEIAWLRRMLKTNLGTEKRITFEDLLTGALGDLADLKTGGATKKGGAGVGVIQSLRNTINADLRHLPADLTPAEQTAVNHLKRLKRRLVPGLDSKDLADVRAGITRWGKTLRDAIKDQATKASQAAQAAAEEAARLWERGWQNAANQVLRSFQERIVQPQLDAFDRETQRGLAAIQAKYGAQTPAEKALADFQAKRAADEEAKRKADLQAQIADTEAQLAALQSGGGTSGTLIDIATGSRTGIPGDGSDPVSQQQQLQQQLLDLQEQYNQLQLDDQEAALQAAADQSRAAADAKEQAAEAAYQDQRDQQRQALQDMLDDQQTALQQSLDDWEAAIEAKKKSWLDFIAWLKANGYDTAGLTNPSGSSGGGRGGRGGSGGGGALPPPIHPGPIHMATGGKVPGRFIGRDSIPTILEPGETILDRRLTAALERIVLQGGGDLGGGVGDVYLDSYKVGRTVARPVADGQRRQISYTLQRG